MPLPPAETPADDTSRADVGLVCALPMELDPFFDRCERVRTVKGGGFRFRGGRLGEIRVAAVESGPGPDRAARATRALLDGHAPAWVVSCGFAGALRDGIGLGDVVVATAVSDTRAELETPHGMAADPSRGLHVGRFLTVDHVVRTAAEKRGLAAAHDAIAVDMETYPVAAACRSADVPFMAVRAVTDGAAEDLPVEVHALLQSSGSRRFGAAVGALWNRPESAKDLWRLRERARRAADRLAPFLAGVVQQLHAASRKRG